MDMKSNNGNPRRKIQDKEIIKLKIKNQRELGK
jgi:hypothetical protein